MQQSQGGWGFELLDQGKNGKESSAVPRFTELGVISREGRRQGAVEGNGRRGKKSMVEETGQKREQERTFIFSFEIWGL